MTVIKDIMELRNLGLDMQKKLQIDLILQSLISSYIQFIIIFYMNKLNGTIPEMINMLVTKEETLKSSKDTVLTVEWTCSKRKSIGKKKTKSTKK